MREMNAAGLHDRGSLLEGHRADDNTYLHHIHLLCLQLPDDQELVVIP